MKEGTEEKLKQRNIKPTAMRMLVYDVLDKQKKAVSLVEIERELGDVDRSTVFRTLKTFQDNLLIHSVDDGSGAVKYALCDDDCTCAIDDQHIHFLCTVCGQTYCLKDLPIPHLNLPEGFTFESANFVVKGICAECRR